MTKLAKRIRDYAADLKRNHFGKPEASASETITFLKQLIEEEQLRELESIASSIDKIKSVIDEMDCDCLERSKIHYRDCAKARIGEILNSAANDSKKEPQQIPDSADALLSFSHNFENCHTSEADPERKKPSWALREIQSKVSGAPEDPQQEMRQASAINLVRLNLERAARGALVFDKNYPVQRWAQEMLSLITGESGPAEHQGQRPKKTSALSILRKNPLVRILSDLFR